MKINKASSVLLLGALIAFIIPATVHAQQDGVWGVDADGLWSNAGNWAGGTIADGVGSTASFVNLITASRTVTSDVARTNGNLIFTGSAALNWTLTNTTALVLNNAAGLATISVNSNTATINASGNGLAGTNTVLKNGAGTLALAWNNTYSGGTILGQGTIALNNTAAGQLGSGNVTITNGAILSLYRGNTTDDGSTIGTFTNNLVIPAGQAGTVWTSPRSVSGSTGSASTITPSVTGGGTLNLRVNGNTRSGNAMNFSAFTGTINVTSRSGADNFFVSFAGTAAPGFPSAKVHLSAGVTLDQWLNPPNGTPFTTAQPIGELSGDVGSILGGNPVAGRFVNWTVGYLNTTATFAGTIKNDAGAALITKVGTGTWYLSGTNIYTGATLISTGAVYGVTGGSISNTPSITVGSTAKLGVLVASAGGQWTGTNVIFTAGTPSMEINYQAYAASASVAPLRVLGNLTTANTITVNVLGGVWTPGTYPLVKYTGSLAGVGFSAFSLGTLPLRVAATLNNNLANSSIDLVVSSVSEPLKWTPASGTWDIGTSSNWKDSLNTVTTYQEQVGVGDQVVFDDSASGPSPNAITLNTLVSPSAFTASNSSLNYIISGTGGIGGGLTLNKLGTGILELDTTNAYLGGTVIGGGVVALNTLAAGGSALGTGSVTLTNGGTLAFYSSSATTDPGTGAAFTNPLVVPAGQTATISNAYRGTLTGALTGGGTLNVNVNGNRNDVSANWSAFTGQLNLTAFSASEFRIANFQASGYGKLNLGDNVNFHQTFNPPSGSGTQTVQPIGELAGTALAILGGNPVGGRFVNWTVGSLNTSSTFAGTIQNDAGAARLTKIGTGALTLSGNSTYTGFTLVSNGTLIVTGSLGSTLVTNYTGTTLAGTGTLGGAVDLESGSQISAGVGAGVVGTLTLNGGLIFNGGTNIVDISSGANDQLIVSGGMYLANGGSIKLNVSGTLPVGTYKLIGYDSLANGSVGNLTLTGFAQVGQNATLNDTGSEIDLVVAANGGANLTWVGDGANNFWDTATSLNWNNGAGATLFNNGDKVTFNDTGSASPAINLTTVVSPGAVTVSGTSSYTFSGTGKITGAGGLTKNGTSTLTILTPNDNSGGTLINSGGTVQVGNGTTTGDIGTGNITNNGTLVFSQTDPRFVNGVLSGSGGITQQGSSTLTLLQNNTYKSQTIISSGTLQIGNNNSVTGKLGTNSVVDNGKLTFNTATAFSLSNTISGSGEVDFAGSALVTLGGPNTYQGNTVISNGVVKLTASELIPDAANVPGSLGWLILNGGATNGGTLDLNGFNESVNVLAGTGGTVVGVVTNSGSTGTNTLTIGNDFNSDPAAAFAGIIVDNPTGAKVALVKQGGSFNILSGPSTFTGGTIIKAGILTLVNGTAAGVGTITMSNSATLNLAPNGNNSVFLGNSIYTGAGVQVTNSSTAVGNSFSGLFFSGDANSTNVFAGTNSIGANNVKQFQSFAGTVQIAPGASVRFSSTSLATNGGDNTTFDIEGSLNTRNGSANPGISLGALTGSGFLVGAGNATGAGTYIIGAKGIDSTFAGTIQDGGFGNVSILKVGAAKLTLSGTVSYTGVTTVSNGMLALVEPVSLDSNPTINLNSSSATIDVSGRTDGTLNLGNAKAQTLNGIGTISGSLNEAANSFVKVGLGTLTVTGTATLNGATTLQVNRTNVITHSEITAASFAISGALTVTNVGPAFVGGETFQLFNTAVTGFTATNLPALTGSMYWTNKLAVNGTVAVINPVNTNPPPIIASFNGTILSLSWPTNAGWTLQQQTNNLATGLSTNWVDVPGSTTITATNITVDPAKPTVFYRLKL